MNRLAIFLMLAGCWAAGTLAAGPNPHEAVALMQQGKFPEAMAIFEQLADQGDARAMVSVGYMYHLGQGVKPDYGRAMDWYLRALKEDSPDAYNNVAAMYQDGLGVKKNVRIAFALLYISARRKIGGDATLAQSQQNVQKLAALLTPEDLNEALRYSEEYVKEYVSRRGLHEEQYRDLALSSKYPPISALPAR